MRRQEKLLLQGCGDRKEWLEEWWYLLGKRSLCWWWEEGNKLAVHVRYDISSSNLHGRESIFCCTRREDRWKSVGAMTSFISLVQPISPEPPSCGILQGLCWISPSSFVKSELQEGLQDIYLSDDLALLEEYFRLTSWSHWALSSFLLKISFILRKFCHPCEPFYHLQGWIVCAITLMSAVACIATLEERVRCATYFEKVLITSDHQGILYQWNTKVCVIFFAPNSPCYYCSLPIFWKSKQWANDCYALCMSLQQPCPLYQQLLSMGGGVIQGNSCDWSLIHLLFIPLQEATCVKIHDGISSVPINVLEASNQGKEIWIGFSDGSLAIMNIAKTTIGIPWKGHPSGVSCLVAMTNSVWSGDHYVLNYFALPSSLV